jgi:vacuolar protein sorting-associated protein 54
VQREVRLAHLKEVQSGVQAVRGVVETVGIVRGLVDDGQWGAALDGVDELRAMWDGKAVSTPSAAPSLRDSLLPSVAEEEPLEDEKEVAPRTEEIVSPAAALEIPLSKLKAFAALPSQLHTLTQEITSSLTSDLVATLKVDLLERIYTDNLVPGDKTDVCDRLRPLIQGLVRTKNLRESIAEWRGVVLGEVQGIVRQVCPLLLDLPWAETDSHRSLYLRLTLERTPKRSPLMQGQLFECAMYASVHHNLQLDKFFALNDPPRVQGSPPFSLTRLS